MKKIHFLPLICWLLVTIPASGQRTPKAIFIIADGIPADVIEKHPAPALHAIARKGSYLRSFVGGGKGSYSESPTISAVGYNSLLTGTWTNKHNVWDNDIAAPRYIYPTIFRLFKDQYPEKQTGIFSTWLDNRTKLVEAGLSETGHFRFDHVADGFENDTIQFPHDKMAAYIHRIDEHVVTITDSVIRNQAPDLSWVYLEYTDDMGHRFGDSKEQHDAISLLDNQIRRISEAVAYRENNFSEDWLMIITTDHGRDSISGRDHGGQSARERSAWIVGNKPLQNAYTRSAIPAVVDILPTLASHLRVTIPEKVARELDGVPLSGAVSVSGLSATYTGGRVSLRWNAHDADSLEITTAPFNTADDAMAASYQFRSASEPNDGTFSFPFTFQTGWVKIALKGRYNTVNVWLRNPEN